MRRTSIYEVTCDECGEVGLRQSEPRQTGTFRHGVYRTLPVGSILVQDFPAFSAHVATLGQRPSLDHSLDRINSAARWNGPIMRNMELFG